MTLSSLNLQKSVQPILSLELYLILQQYRYFLVAFSALAKNILISIRKYSLKPLYNCHYFLSTVLHCLSLQLYYHCYYLRVMIFMELFCYSLKEQGLLKLGTNVVVCVTRMRLKIVSDCFKNFNPRFLVRFYFYIFSYELIYIDGKK